MEPVSNIDRILILLRQRLTEQARSTTSSRRPAERSGHPLEPTALEALASAEAVDDRALKRTLIQSILAEQFGAKTLNDPQFQAVVEKVTESLDAHDETSGLFSEVIAHLRGGAG